MSVAEEYVMEIVKLILAMTLTGSTVSFFLFAIKPIIKNKLPKGFQYYMWFPVIMAFLLPLSQMVVIPALGSPAMPMKSTQDIAQWIVDKASVQPIDFLLAPQMENGQEALKTTTVFFLFWQLGTILFFSFQIVCYALYVQRLKKYNRNANQQEMELLHGLSGSKNIPGLYKNPAAATPVLVGIFRPAIILPDKKYEDIELQSILLHEITHMRKHDIVIKWLLILVGALHWFNPVTYFVRREIDRACELACDESVIKKLDNAGRQHYGNALIMVAADTIRKVPISMPMLKDKNNLKERLNAIMKHKDFPKKTIYLSGILLVAILCGTFYLGIARSLTAQKKEGMAAVTDSTPIQEQKVQKEIELMQALYDYDKENIVGVWVALEDSYNEIISANIFVVSKDGIMDAKEQDKIEAIASGHLNLDAQNISLQYMDSETFYAQELKKP